MRKWEYIQIYIIRIGGKRETDKQTDTEKDRQAKTETDRHTERHTDTYRER